MTRNIDFTKPLSDDELDYVNDRPWLLQDLELSGLDLITQDDVEDAEEAPETYNGWNKPDLVTELDRRNLERDEDSQIEPEKSTVEGIKAALLADDEAQRESEEDDEDEE